MCHYVNIRAVHIQYDCIYSGNRIPRVHGRRPTFLYDLMHVLGEVDVGALTSQSSLFRYRLDCPAQVDSGTESSLELCIAG